MSFIFQLADSVLSLGCDVPRVIYGDDVHRPAAEIAGPTNATQSAESPDEISCKQRLKPAATHEAMVKAAKDLAAASIAGVVESAVSNRAEVQRHHGITRFEAIERRLNWRGIQRLCGPAFAANASRNTIMAHSAFVVTPILYANHMPQEHKSGASFFAFGLGVNMFLGNVVAVTQQALWGRTVDAFGRSSGGLVSYRAVIADGLAKEGVTAFITPAKWFTRVLMNAPAEGTLAWFYNRVLPIGEPAFLRSVHSVYKTAVLFRELATASR